MHYKFPSNFVYWDKVSNHEQVKEKYYQKILDSKNDIEDNNKWIAKLKTSYNNLGLNNFLYGECFAKDVIWPYFDNMLVEMQSNLDQMPIESYINYAWFNLYEKGDYQETHQHDRNYIDSEKTVHTNAFCGIYLLHLEEENKTVFYQEPPVPCSATNSGVNFQTNFLEEGSIMFFPSGLSHYVLPSDSKRCTISFNITSVYSKIISYR